MSAEITSALKAMKLHGMASNYPEVAAQARHTDFTPEAFLTQLLKAETAERAVRSMAYQMGAARFPAHRDLAGFEFAQAVRRGDCKQFVPVRAAAPRFARRERNLRQPVEAADHHIAF